MQGDSPLSLRLRGAWPARIGAGFYRVAHTVDFRSRQIALPPTSGNQYKRGVTFRFKRSDVSLIADRTGLWTFPPERTPGGCNRMR